MKKSVIVNYSFDKAAKTVTFDDFSSIALGRILNIIDVTNGQSIYNHNLPGYIGTVATNVLTLAFDTNNDQFSNSDKLYIEIIGDNYGEEIVASALRSITTNHDPITNYDAKGAIFCINVTAIDGTPTLAVKIQMKDVVSGTWVDIPGAVTSSITTVSSTLLAVYPGLTVSANAKIDYPLPRVYRAVSTIGSTVSITYSISAQYIN